MKSINWLPLAGFPHKATADPSSHAQTLDGHDSLVPSLHRSHRELMAPNIHDAESPNPTPPGEWASGPGVNECEVHLTKLRQWITRLCFDDQRRIQTEKRFGHVVNLFEGRLSRTQIFQVQFNRSVVTMGLEGDLCEDYVTRMDVDVWEIWDLSIVLFNTGCSMHE